MSSRGDELVSLYVKDIVEKDLYFSEAENGLMQIIKLYNQQPTIEYLVFEGKHFLQFCY